MLLLIAHFEGKMVLVSSPILVTLHQLALLILQLEDSIASSFKYSWSITKLNYRVVKIGTQYTVQTEVGYEIRVCHMSSSLCKSCKLWYDKIVVQIEIDRTRNKHEYVEFKSQQNKMRFI